MLDAVYKRLSNKINAKQNYLFMGQNAQSQILRTAYHFKPAWSVLARKPSIWLFWDALAKNVPKLTRRAPTYDPSFFLILIRMIHFLSNEPTQTSDSIFATYSTPGPSPYAIKSILALYWLHCQTYGEISPYRTLSYTLHCYRANQFVV